ncbi:hypothetical protein J5X07_04435 [Actinomyces bowdenii]|uniref:hypothetical protein n=1 Tax=Actinomyces bowdenii TaxID=131109 RepID=UPI001ABC13BE|nr:hypothetical protein [Actinomyces bowdenii]MBO3724279.1 hypothetical protein [Actinomyces bowdenii]
MAVDRSNDPEVEQVVMTLCRVLEEDGREPMSDADMALLLLLDVAYGGMTAGMTAHAWLDASAREAHGPNWRACPETASRNRLEALSEEATHRLTDSLDTSGRSTRESLSDLRQGV